MSRECIITISGLLPVDLQYLTETGGWAKLYDRDKETKPMIFADKIAALTWLVQNCTNGMATRLSVDRKEKYKVLLPR